MPFKSEKQRRYMYKNKPAIAKKWSKKYGKKIKKSKKGK
jgi:hypothetical protein|tara:strand:- start:218 stop:334 length:117 start_codon:yes stop_codon:yes gene_type:complete